MPFAYVVLDLEWNQGWYHGKQCSELLQIGAVGLDENFRITGSFSSYLRPVHLRRLNHKILQLTGADADEVRAAEDFPTVWPRFHAWCGDALLLTWGPSDETMLRRNLKLYGVTVPAPGNFYNLQLAYVGAEKLSQEPSLAAVVEALGLDEELAYHDALNDARYTAAVARALAARCGGQLPDSKTVHHQISRMAAERLEQKQQRICERLCEAVSKAEVVSCRRVTGFVSRQSGIISARTRRITCPACGWNTGANALFCFAPQQYIACVSCPSHGEIFLHLILEDDEDEKISVFCRQLAPNEQLHRSYRAARGCLPTASMEKPRRRSRRAAVKKVE